MALQVRIGPREVLILPAAHTARALLAALTTRRALAAAGAVRGHYLLKALARVGALWNLQRCLQWPPAG